MSMNYLISILLAFIPNNTREYPAVLVECYDGDTCTFDINIFDSITYRANIRFCDIDTPEMNKSTKEAAIKARDEALALMTNRTIKLRFPLNTKQNFQKTFDRYLAYIIADDIDVGATLVKREFAVWSDKKCIK